MQCDRKDTRIVIGVDEAGYGPNIGPLIVAATAWRVPVCLTEKKLVDSMAQDFRAAPWTAASPHVPLGDSKKLYSPAGGLYSLEAGLLAMLGQIQPPATDFHQLLKSLGVPVEPDAEISGFSAWHRPLNGPLPAHVSAEDLSLLSARACHLLQALDMELVAARARVITESEFNSAVARYGSKGRLLSDATLELTTELMSCYAEYPIEVFCDRQGGRKKYSGVLMQAMPDDWFDVVDEQDARSSYQRRRHPECKVHFSVGGDSFPPTALASMIAKYLRERFMEIINRYWQQHVAGLQPTAGYPVDAKRFRDAIAAKAAALGHTTEQWWRVC